MTRAERIEAAAKEVYNHFQNYPDMNDGDGGEGIRVLDNLEAALKLPEPSTIPWVEAIAKALQTFQEDHEFLPDPKDDWEPTPTCEHCDGTPPVGGSAEMIQHKHWCKDAPIVKCTACQGTGNAYGIQPAGTIGFNICSHCKGSGRADER